MQDPSIDTQAPARVEQAVWQRVARSNQPAFVSRYHLRFVGRYPSSLSHHVHKAKVYLPVDVAKALSVNPALVQKATESFYTRDAIQLRVRNSPYDPVPSHPLPRQRTR